MSREAKHVHCRSATANRNTSFDPGHEYRPNNLILCPRGDSRLYRRAWDNGELKGFLSADFVDYVDERLQRMG